MGLRPRLLAALVLTAAATLAAAALFLLQPLQERLREQTVAGVLAAARTARPSFEDALRGPFGSALREEIELEERVDARVAVLPEVAPRGEVLPPEALATLRTRTTTVTMTEERLTTALLLRVPGERDAVLFVRKRFTDVAAAVGEVRRAFIAAALAGLVVAALLGFALTATLLRRLERLRQAALRREPAPYDPARDEVGDLARALAEMQHGLRRQEEARRTFVATASHELRTPLTSLQGMLELLDDDLREGRVDPDDAHEQIARAQGQLRRLEHLATDLLDLSRLDAEVELRSEPVELGELARAVAAEFERRAADRGVRVEVVPPIGPCWGRGDPGALARIVRILLDNALRFAPPGTPVTVSSAYHGPSATIEVGDVGPGVPPAERVLIFERFQRGTRTGGEGGFGLGLAIGRELAERLGGRLELADDDAPGTRFVLRVPIEMPAGTQREADVVRT